jgi:glutamate-1-semialdehyde 2,1-aminomutase
MEVITGGVTANVKYYDPYPIYMRRAKGSKLYDVDGNEYIDYCLSFGPLILGHGHPEVVGAIRKQLEESGTTIYGTPHELEMRMAERITTVVPCAESVRFTNSGLEATMHTLRLARAFTGRKKIAKFEGHYHGAHDYVTISVTPRLEEAGPPDSPNSVPDSSGILPSIIENTVVLPFNDLDSMQTLIRKNADDLAAVILEPAVKAYLMSDQEFAKGLREITEEKGIVLIYDEVMTGFRYGLHCAQGYLGVTPDLVTLGKIVGGGLPAGAFAGKKEIMELVSPQRSTKEPRVFHSGTYNGCPTVMAAGLATLDVLARTGSYEHIDGIADDLKKGMKSIFERENIDAQIVGPRNVFNVLFTPHKIINYRDTLKADAEKRAVFDLCLVNNGIYIRTTRAFYTSLAHSSSDVEKTLQTVERAAKKINE